MAKRSGNYDLENASFEYSGVKGSLIGLSSPAVYRLALIGVISLLKNKKNPFKTWAAICDGTYFQTKKKYPIVVQAWANLQDIPLDEAMSQWNDLSREDKYKTKNLPQIRMEVARLQGGDEPL